MKKMVHIILYIILINFVAIISSAYIGQVGTNISVYLTNGSLSIYNSKLGNQTISFNVFNLTEIDRNYSWNVDYQYDFTGQNVTIITYNYSNSNNITCSYLEDDLAEIKSKFNTINCSSNTDTAEKYRNLYFGCFENITVCNEFRRNSQDYQIKYAECDSNKNNYYQQNLRWEIVYGSLNQSCSAISLERDNYQGQRWIWALLSGLIIGGLVYFFKVVYPNIHKSGKLATRKDTFTSMSTAPSIYNMKEITVPSPPPIPPIPEYGKAMPNIMEIKEVR